MSVRLDRRRFMGAITVIAALPLFPAIARAAVFLPDGPMMLTRRLERDLADGNMIMVERTWRIAFSRLEGGIRVSGNQIGVRVDVPPSLEQMAELERNRDASGLFPLSLNEDGRIIQAGTELQADDLDRAAQLARDMIEQSGMPQDAQSAMRRMLSQLQAASLGALEGLPPDLLFPTGGEIANRRSVELPNGTIGEFEYLYSATPADKGQWLGNARREIITHLGGQSRKSREFWQMTEL